jgi:hypothetical protein
MMSAEWRSYCILVVILLMLITVLLISAVNDLSAIRWQLENR